MIILLNELNDIQCNIVQLKDHEDCFTMFYANVVRCGAVTILATVNRGSVIGNEIPLPPPLPFRSRRCPVARLAAGKGIEAEPYRYININSTLGITIDYRIDAL